MSPGDNRAAPTCIGLAAAPDGAGERQQPDDVGGQVAGDPLQGGVFLHAFVSAPDQAVARHAALGLAGARRGPAEQTGSPVGGRGRHRAVGDIGMADVEGIEEGVVGGQQTLRRSASSRPG